MNVKQLKKILSKYPDEMEVTDEQNAQLLYVGKIKNTLIISAKNPIGICNYTGENVFPLGIDLGVYLGFSPALNRNLSSFEFRNIGDEPTNTQDIDPNNYSVTFLAWDYESDIKVNITEGMYFASLEDKLGRVYPYVIVDSKKYYLEDLPFDSNQQRNPEVN